MVLCIDGLRNEIGSLVQHGMLGSMPLVCVFATMSKGSLIDIVSSVKMEHIDRPEECDFSAW